MKQAFALALGLAAIILQAEDNVTSELSDDVTSSKAAYIRQETPPKQALAPVIEAIPLNADFANKQGSPDTQTQEVSKADLVLQREQKNWLAVGVQKLSGDYKIDNNLTAEDKEEIAEKRASLSSPTMFIDHFARLNQARSTQDNQEHTVDWNDAFMEPILDQPLNLSAGWQDNPVILTHASSAPRQNPYLKQVRIEATSEIKQIQPSTEVANFSSYVPIDTARRQSFTPAAMTSTAPVSQNLLPAPAPTTSASDAPNTTPLREKRDRNEKYFKDLERF